MAQRICLEHRVQEVGREVFRANNKLTTIVGIRTISSVESCGSGAVQ